MKTHVHEVTEITRRIDVTVPANEVKEELEKAYQAIGKKAKLKGFREGKIPQDVLEKHYRQDAESQAVQEAISKSYPRAIDQCGIHPVSYPEISVKKFKVNEELQYEATVEIRPVVKPKGYTGLELTKQGTEPTPQEIDESLKGLQERSAQLEPILESRPVKEGDMVLFDYQGYKNGKPVPEIKAQGHLAELGKNALIPDFEKGILGMKPGDQKKIDVTYPAQWGDAKVAGQAVQYHVTLKEMKKKRLPELNDDFAKDLGEFTTLTQVKEKLKEQILLTKEQQEKNKMSQEIIKQLSEKNKFPIPEGMLQVELEAMYRNFIGSLRQQGLDPKQIGIKPEEFVEKNREEAKFRVTAALILEAIAKKENITVPAEEIDQRIEMMAKGAGQAPAAWQKYYKENNLRPGVEAALQEEKTLDFIRSKAKIKTQK